MPEQPLVSVIVPAFNAAAFIERTLASALSQTYKHLEVIVVDDGSEDETCPVVEAVAARDARVSLLKQSNQGVAAARNRAIAASRGAFIAPLDADDLWFPEKIEWQVRRLQQADSSVGLVYVWWVGLDEADQIVGAAPRWDLEGFVFESLLYVNFIGNASVPLIRRPCIEQVGGYSTALRSQGGQGCEDWDLSLRIAEQYQFGVVPAYLAGYRQGYDSMTSNARAMKRSYDLILEDVRRRKPDLSSELLRWSRSQFYNYLASLHYNRGDFWAASKQLLEVVRIDPAAALAPEIAKRYLKSLMRVVAAPVTSQIWPEHADWVAFKHQIRPRTALQLADLQASATEVSPFAWKAWKPYDRIRLKRWARVRAGASAKTSRGTFYAVLQSDSG
jgi:glycosyltransferase involved in cell wall biosynthesis